RPSFPRSARSWMPCTEGTQHDTRILGVLLLALVPVTVARAAPLAGVTFPDAEARHAGEVSGRLGPSSARIAGTPAPERLAGSSRLPHQARGLSNPVVELRDQGRNAPEGEQVGGVGFVAVLHACLAALFAALQACLQVLSCFAHAALQSLSFVRICTLHSLGHLDLASAGEGARPAPSTSTANPTMPAVSFLMMSPLSLDF